MELSSAAIQQIANASAKLGALAASIQNGTVKPYLNKSQAFCTYGRKRVERWLEKGLITFIKDGDHSAAWRLERISLAALDAAETLVRFL